MANNSIEYAEYPFHDTTSDQYTQLSLWKSWSYSYALSINWNHLLSTVHWHQLNHKWFCFAWLDGCDCIYHDDWVSTEISCVSSYQSYWGWSWTPMISQDSPRSSEQTCNEIIQPPFLSIACNIHLPISHDLISILLVTCPIGCGSLSFCLGFSFCFCFSLPLCRCHCLGLWRIPFKHAFVVLCLFFTTVCFENLLHPSSYTHRYLQSFEHWRHMLGKQNLHLWQVSTVITSNSNFSHELAALQGNDCQQLGRIAAEKVHAQLMGEGLHVLHHREKTFTFRKLSRLPKEAIPQLKRMKISKVSGQASTKVKYLASLVLVGPVLADVVPLLFLVLTISEGEALEVAIPFPRLPGETYKKMSIWIIWMLLAISSWSTNQLFCRKNGSLQVYIGV